MSVPPYQHEHEKSMETMVYKKVNDLEIHADVYLPKKSLPGLPPCIYYVHGGGFILGNRTSFPPEQFMEMLRLGWAVVSVDYRLSPNVTLKDIYEDVADGYSWIRRELNTQVDVNRIAVWGHSAGGTLAEAAGYILYPRPKVLVSFYGLVDFTLDYNSDPSIPTPDYSALADQVTTGMPLDITNQDARKQDPRALLFFSAIQSGKIAEILVHSKDVDLIRRYSPINNMGLDYPPIYLTHGTSDTLIPDRQSVLFAELAKEKGIPYELTIAPGAPHAFDIYAKPNTGDEIWDKYISPAFDFVQKYL